LGRAALRLRSTNKSFENESGLEIRPDRRAACSPPAPPATRPGASRRTSRSCRSCCSTADRPSDKHFRNWVRAWRRAGDCRRRQMRPSLQAPNEDGDRAVSGGARGRGRQHAFQQQSPGTHRRHDRNDNNVRPNATTRRGDDDSERSSSLRERSSTMTCSARSPTGCSDRTDDSVVTIHGVVTLGMTVLDTLLG
jgi:hypothetical protein